MSCADCKHWDRDGSSYHYFDSQGSDNARLCKLIPHGGYMQTGGPVTRSVGAYVMDASGYSAALYSQPWFNCSAFEAK